MDLLLLPGLMCDAAVWAPLQSELDAVGAVAIPRYADATSLGDMAARILAEAPPTFALAGHSMGGRVALEIARRAPGRVERIALLDTGCHARPEGPAGEEEKARRYALLALARTQGVRAMAREWVRPMIHPDRLTDRALIDAILDMFERRTAAEFAWQIEALLARPDATAVLRSLDCPALVLCGRDDGWSTPAQHEEMAALIRHAHLVVIEHCGHMATMERPREVAAELLAWLRAPREERTAQVS